MVKTWGWTWRTRKKGYITTSHFSSDTSMKLFFIDGGVGSERAPRGTFPPYIHFTLQKTNRDTQDALSHLSRMLKVNVKDLSVAGTKDKRGVTVQRVSLKRNNKTVEDVWNLANAVTNGRKSAEEAVKERGERGVRIADFNYRKASLELGLLKGNAFVITLRYVDFTPCIHSLLTESGVYK